MKINFAGAIQDVMGYGEFARNFAVALHNVGAEVSVDPIILSRDKADFGENYKACQELTKKKFKPDINIINMIPPLFAKHRKPGCKNIGFTMFETSRLPASWVKLCNGMDAVIVPSQWNAEVFKSSGVKVPVLVAPPGIEVFDALKPSKPRASDKFAFYSIFQWSERKNPTGLIRAFWAAFTGRDDVRLVIKSYRRDHSAGEQAKIKQEIAALKSKVKLRHYPEIEFIGDLLSRQEITDLHLNSDCFVLPHRAEGWGLPHYESMSYGNPVIATGYSSNMDFMTPENSFPLNYTLTPVMGMEWLPPWYEGNMLWAEPDLSHLVDTMRWVVDNREGVQQKAELGRQDLKDKFSWDICSKRLLEDLEGLL